MLLTDLRDFYGQSRHASYTPCNLLSGEMGPDIRQCGELGPTLSLEGRLFGGPGPRQSCLTVHACGTDGPHNILSLKLGQHSFHTMDAVSGTK